MSKKRERALELMRDRIHSVAKGKPAPKVPPKKVVPPKVFNEKRPSSRLPANASKDVAGEVGNLVIRRSPQEGVLLYLGGSTTPICRIVLSTVHETYARLLFQSNSDVLIIREEVVGTE